jgi:Autographiviridae peptidoglycan hydrolase
MAESFIGQTNLPRGLRNNNPGDIRAQGFNWQGMIGQDSSGFVVFQDISWGVRALARDITTKIGEGYDTITTLITRYAPPSENDTASYIRDVAADTGLDPSLQLGTDPDTLSSLIRAIMNHEMGNQFSAMVSDADITQGIEMAGNAVTSLAQAVPVAIETAINTVTGSNPSGVDGSGVAIGVAAVIGAGLMVLFLNLKKLQL